MSKLFKRVTLSVLCAILVACAVAVGAIFGLNSRANNNSKGFADDNGGKNVSAAAATLSSASNYSQIFDLTGTCAEKAAIWNKAVAVTTGTVLVNVDDDWNANSGSFGTGVGFGNGTAAGTGFILVPQNKKIVLNIKPNVKIDRGLYNGSSIAAGYVVKVDGELEIIGQGKITGGNATDNAGGINVQGKLTLNGGVITKNKGFGGGGIWINGSCNIINGTVTYNTALTEGGGGIWVTVGASFEMSGGEISHNDGKYGGGLHIVGAGTAANPVKITGGLITENTAASSAAGGAFTVSTYNGTPSYVVMSGGTVSKNHATGGAGGAVKVEPSSTFVMEGGTISENDANSGMNASAIYNSGTLTIKGGAITDNAHYGSVVNGNGSTFNMSGGIISGNTGNGGIGYGVQTASNPSTSAATYNLNGGIVTGNLSGILTNQNDTIKLGGPLVVKGNTNYNLIIYQNNKLTVTGELTTSAGNPDIGITLYNGSNYAATGQFTNNCTKAVGASLSSPSINTTTGVAAFHSDNSSYVVKGTAGNWDLLELVAASSPYYSASVTWAFTILNTATATSRTETVTSSTLDISYGEKVTAATATISSPSVAWPNGLVHHFPDVGRPFGITCKYKDLSGNTGASDLSTDPGGTSFNWDAGTYSFNMRFIYFYAEPYEITASTEPGYGQTQGVQFKNPTVTVNVKPVDATVTINNVTTTYGKEVNLNDAGNPQYTSATTFAPGDITLTKNGSKTAGTYDITGVCNNPNYNVTFTNGTYTINKRAVNVDINDQYVTYGSKFYSLTTTENNSNYVAAIGSEREIGGAGSGNWYDSAENPTDGSGYRVDTVGGTNKILNGGWKYADGTLNDNKFLSTDTGNLLPLTITCGNASVTDVTDNTNANYIPVSSTTNNYYITYAVANSNYNVTFTSSQTNGASNKQGILYVEGATIGVKSPAVYDSANLYNKKDYTGSDINVEIPTTPTTALIFQNGVTAHSSIVYKVFKSDDTNIPADVPLSTDTTFWTGASASEKRKDAGTYKVYTLIKAPNHKDTVYFWDFTIGSSGVKYELNGFFGGSTTAITKTDNVYKVTYDNKEVEVKIKYLKDDGTASTITTTDLPVKIYYKGTGTYGSPATNNTFGHPGDASNPDTSGTDENNQARELGCETKPKEVGSYRATVIKDPDSTSGYELDDTCTNTYDFTIEAKKVSKPSAAVASGSSDTYNGNTQTINYLYDTVGIKALTNADSDPYASVSETIGSDAVVYPALTFVSSTPNPTSKKTTTAFTATNAGEYAVKFELENTRNYKWDITDTTQETQPQIVKFTIKQAELTIKFNSPSGGTLASAWQWKPEDEWDTANGKGYITWEIASGICTPSGGSADSVTLSVYHYTVKGGTPDNNSIVEITDTKLDITNTATFGTGSYAIFAMLADDNVVNKNYKIAGDNAADYLLNSDVKVAEQAFTVGTGSISANSIKWSYYTSEKPQDIDVYDKQNTEFKYQLIKVNGEYVPLEYTLTVDTTKTGSLPLGVLLKTDDSTSGFVNGFKTVKVDNGTETVVTKVDTTGTFRTYVSLKVDLANGATVRFKDENDNDVTEWNKYYIEWKVEKGKLDLSGVKWKYEVTTTSGKKTGSVSANEDGEYKASVEYEEVFYYFGIDESTLPAGLTVDTSSKYASTITTNNYRQMKVDKYPVEVESTDLVMPQGFTDLWDVDSSTWSALNLQLEITKKNLFAATGWTTAAEEYDPVGNPGSYYRKKELNTAGNPAYKEYIEYKYFETDASGNPTVEISLEDINAAVDLQVIKRYVVKAFVKDEYAANYDMFDGKEDDGTPKTPSSKFETGSDLEIADAKITEKEVTYDGKTHFTPDMVSINAGKKNLTYTEELTETSLNVFTITYYKGDTLADRLELGKGEYPVDAGQYFVELTLSDTANTMYVLNVTYFRVVINPKPIAVPTLDEITFNNEFINLANHLGGTYLDYKDIIELGGVFDGVKTARKTYVATLTLTDTNYCWYYGEEAESPAKATVRYSLADGENKFTGDERVATLSWQIMPFVITDAMWNLKNKDGAVLNLPADLIEGLDLQLKYQYRTDKAANPEETVEFKAGKKFWVDATLEGDDAENFVFANGKQTSEMVQYSIPQSKTSATFSKIGNFLKDNWLWFVIGAAVLLFLILLIIIIAVAKKKKKKRLAEEEAKAEAKREKEEAREEAKREREEAKAAAAAAAAPMLAASAAMADEKAKLDAEKAKMEAELARSRAEAEAAAAKAKAQAEMDLQKAKMEAEMSKMRAEAEAQAKQMRADAEAQAKQMREQMQQMKQMQQMQQQPAPQPQPMPQPQMQQPMQPQYQQQQMPQQMQQPMQQPMPQPQMQQPMQPQYQQQNNNETAALMELKAEMAAMRAEQRMVQMQMQYRQQPAPAPAPQYSQPAQTDVNAEVRARLAEERAKTAEEQLYRSAEQRAAIAEDRLLRGAYTAQPMSQANVPAISNGAAADNAEVLGAVLASMVRNLASNNVVQQEKISEITQVIEAESQPVVANTPTVYPPDAVITTTTTVDTTNKRSVGDRREETIFDTDGFYDQFDGNK